MREEIRLSTELKTSLKRSSTLNKKQQQELQAVNERNESKKVEELMARLDEEANDRLLKAQFPVEKSPTRHERYLPPPAYGPERGLPEGIISYPIPIHKDPKTGEYIETPSRKKIDLSKLPPPKLPTPKKPKSPAKPRRYGDEPLPKRTTPTQRRNLILNNLPPPKRWDNVYLDIVL